MRQPVSDHTRRDELLWLLTGVLFGLALWLVTDHVAAGLSVAVGLGGVLFAWARSQRAQFDHTRPDHTQPDYARERGRRSTLAESPS